MGALLDVEPVFEFGLGEKHDVPFSRVERGLVCPLFPWKLKRCRVGPTDSTSSIRLTEVVDGRPEIVENETDTRVLPSSPRLSYLFCFFEFMQYPQPHADCFFCDAFGNPLSMNRRIADFQHIVEGTPHLLISLFPGYQRSKQ